MRQAIYKLLWLLVASALCVSGLYAEKLDPVQWTLTPESKTIPPGTTVPFKLSATIEPGWHIYSLTIPKGGPIATTVKLAENPAVASFQVYQPLPERKLDKTIDLDTEMYENAVTLWIPVKLAGDAKLGDLEIEADVHYAVCDDRQCLPPKTKKPTATIKVDPAAPLAAGFVVPPDYTDISDPVAVQLATQKLAASSPVSNGSGNGSSVPSSTDGLGAFALTAFGFGLASILTPCVFPMIPITVSFFLNQRGGIVQAAVFCLGIIGLFCGLGLGVTALLGPFGVSAMSSNPWVNAFIALIFCGFALSLLGAFEITLPTSLLTKMDGASRRGGYLGTLLMGLTFSLTSFACVGPFVGPLLVASAQTSRLQPVIGMAGFATGLASPFFFLAAFPAYLSKLPRSGSWMVRVKVVMGFILLAVMFKYLSNIDQVLQTGYLTRERFLAAWVVLFAMAGLYLLGLLRLEGIDPAETLGVPRLLIGSCLLIFSISLVPGMFGASLGELEAFVPVVTQTSSIGGKSTGPAWMKDQLRQALDLAKEQNKLVLVNFTGYACSNCHWMKANMFTKPEIASALNEFVLVELYTDGEDASSAENQRLEDEKFQTVANPFYVLMDSEQHVVKTFPGSTRNVKEYLSFLESALTSAPKPAGPQASTTQPAI
ncbi:MAG: cytochrome c biogenesis protein CcdA [Acidobacteriota bacterium]